MLRLNVYTDDTYTEVREVREAARIRVPYRVAQYVVNLIPTLDLRKGDDILHHAMASEEEITKVVRATFGLKEEDLEFVDTMELTDVVREIIAFVMQKLADMGIRLGGDDENFQTPATTA